jgi:hypothetical protein
MASSSTVDEMLTLEEAAPCDAATASPAARLAEGGPASIEIQVEIHHTKAK